MANLLMAHNELFRRAPDERFESLDALYRHCRDLRSASTDHWQRPQTLLPQMTDGELALALDDAPDCRLNDWSFSQLCRMAGVNKETLNRLSPQTASLALRETLAGVIASTPGEVTPLQVTGDLNDASGFSLTGANTFTGDVRLREGTLGINANASLGNPSNSLILETNSATAGGLEFLNGGIDVARSVTINSVTRVVSNGTDVSTISGPVTGVGALVKTGTGAVVLTNTDNAGTRDVRGGALRVAAGALGTTGDLILGDGVTLAVTGNNYFGASRSFSLGTVPGPATATVDVAAGQTFTVGGLVMNNAGSTGALVKTGAGSLALDNLANSYTGGTVVWGGAVLATADGSLGAAAAPVAVEPFGTLAYTGDTTTARTFNLHGGSLGVTDGSTLTFANASVAGGFLVGPGAYTTQVGTANTFVGNTTLTAGSLTLNGSDRMTHFVSNGMLTINSDGVLAVSNFVSNGILTINPDGVLANNVAPLVLGGGSRTFIGSAASPGGTLTLGAQTLELNGALLVNNGTITGVTNVNFGSLAQGAGIYGPVNVFEGGVYSPGNSPGTVTVASLQLANAITVGGSKLLIELGGVVQGTEYDHVNVKGLISLGGILDVALLPGFTPSAGESFDILDFNPGNLSGTFAVINLPSLAGSLTWNTSLLYTTGVLSVVSLTVPGDYNNNGVVDAADYIVWRKTDGTPAGYNAWRTHFGQTAGSGSGAIANAAVPEPATVVMLMFVVAGCCLRRGRAA